MREAILASNNTASTAASVNVINVPAGTYNLVSVGTVELQVGTSTALGTSIVGAGAATTTIHQTAASQRVFNLDPNVLGNITVNIINNWWGCNGGPGAAGCDTIANGAGASSFNPWIVLNNTASPNPIGRANRPR